MDVTQLWDKFSARVLARLESGSREYGNVSLALPSERLIDEIQQELEDVAGWGLLLWTRLQRCRKAAAKVDQHANEELVALRAVADAARNCLAVVATDETDESLLDNLSAKLIDLEVYRTHEKPKKKIK